MMLGTRSHTRLGVAWVVLDMKPRIVVSAMMLAPPLEHQSNTSRGTRCGSAQQERVSATERLLELAQARVAAAAKGEAAVASEQRAEAAARLLALAEAEVAAEEASIVDEADTRGTLCLLGVRSGLRGG